MEAPFQPGAVLAGKYVVEGMIGHGGSGFVLSAQHLVLKKRVAVKLLHDAVAGIPEAAARFLREAQTVARLTSVHTVRIMDADRLDTGRPYIVMEYLEGRDLRTVAKETGPLDARVAANYVAQACEGIAEAHARGVVHRDLKPSNLFLTTDGIGRHLVKVLDFGVSKLSPLPGDPLDNLAITRTCQVFGSPRFMSPEQMHSARDTDARTDIWSLGVTLFVLVSGRYPFEGEGLVGLERAIRTGPRPTLGAGAPAALDAIVERCLQIEPSRRYQTAAELALELARFAESDESLPELPPEELHTIAPGVGVARPLARRLASSEAAAAISPGWGPIVVEQGAAPAGRDSTKAPIALVAALIFGAAAAVIIGVWLVASSAAQRTEAARAPVTTTDPIVPPAEAAAAPAANPATPTTSVAAPALGDFPTPRGQPSRTPTTNSPAAQSAAARARPKSSESSAVRIGRRAAATTSTEQARTVGAPHPASSGDTTLRDFELIHEVPRR